ncbi:MAG: bifunctional phosphopantothenoylcysteine decarboxylase/phosphopantothenate--cysteine ligase CoaBC [Nitrospinae bacterium]|nr:bifunctional phosphopantothenoylcysteine decarboxylase/phosphopantothenate--cysteine ligase CoaBC [Nitrospinota bacterium]MZH03776.1 bifunctional phosphopantothenoylcysteine decarboxylase/phosphopantothenate--cysteine ligase CoaBC [Nitrospinota bacterium]MZH15446.1 bifunctional phosphopantothenoylcysteine decarboxylase/phosphopantothenate--cysteine ligase CoaBC [Nitrospinota bacterium]
MKNKKIALAVSAGIAAYKAVELLRMLVKEGADVRVVMSANAGQFVTPLTFESLSGNPVYHQLFNSERSADMEHIRVAENADLMLVVPATASTLGKMANGLADDALSNLYLAFKGPVMAAPAMNEGMWGNLAVRKNIEQLKSRGVEFIEPEEGELACGTTGPGRLADLDRIFSRVKSRFEKLQDLRGIKILVTAGPTHEPLDPVRYLSNPSSGKMGYAIAGQAQARGGEVVLISGPTHLKPPTGVGFKSCKTAEEMNQLVQEFLPECDALIMSAAVGDFTAEKLEKEKIKKQSGEGRTLNLVPTKDILMEVSKVKTHQFVVGFAAETQNLVQSALEKLRNKKLDLIVANDISAPGIGFQSDNNQVTLIDADEKIENLPRMSKKEIADILLDKIPGHAR